MTFTPDEQYAQVTLTYLVDNVCLHAAKVEEIRQAHQEQIKALQAPGQGADDEEDAEEQVARLT